MLCLVSKKGSFVRLKLILCDFIDKKSESRAILLLEWSVFLPVTQKAEVPSFNWEATSLKLINSKVRKTHALFAVKYACMSILKEDG